MVERRGEAAGQQMQLQCPVAVLLPRVEVILTEESVPDPYMQYLCRGVGRHHAHA